MTGRVALVATIGLFILAITVSAETNVLVCEGLKPYTPTRLEWLSMMLNANLRVPLSEDSGYSMDFVPSVTDDSILICVRYLPSVNREVMNMSIDGARAIIPIYASAHGWSSWLKIKEKITLATKQPVKAKDDRTPFWENDVR